MESIDSEAPPASSPLRGTSRALLSKPPTFLRWFCDLEAFFDTVDHRKLMEKLRERIADPRALKLILKYLKAGAILPDGTFEDAD